MGNEGQIQDLIGIREFWDGFWLIYKMTLQIIGQDLCFFLRS